MNVLDTLLGFLQHETLGQRWNVSEGRSRASSAGGSADRKRFFGSKSDVTALASSFAGTLQ